MNVPSRETLEATLATIESRPGPLSEHHISGEIRRLREKDDPSPRPTEWVAEVMAFDFCEDYPDNGTGWGTFFGPMMAGTDENGTRWESPPLALVTPEVLEYWAKRARESKHPVLKARYAGLVWDLTRAATKASPPIEMAWIRIDSIIEIAAQGGQEFEVQTIKQLEHALRVSVAINGPVRVERVRNAILAYADQVGEDDKPGLWCFVYDLLWDQKKVPLTEAQKAKIISDLEARLARVSDTSGDGPIDPWAAEAAAIRLAKHYRAEGRSEDVRRVLLKYGGAFEKMAEPAAPMLAQAWAQQVHQVYRDFGLKEDAERLLRRIRDLGPKTLDDLKPITTQMKIAKEEMEAYVRELIDGDLDTALGRIAGHYLPRKDQVEKQVRDLSAQAPLTSLFTAQFVDHKGRPTATVGSIEDDLDGHIIKHMAQNIEFSAVFLREVMAALVSKFAVRPNTLTEYLCRTPLLEDDARAIVERGITAYLDGDALVAMHVLIPQVENAVRVLVENTGGTVLRPNRSGGMDLKTFDELLRDERVSSVFRGEDVPLYLRVLFTERRGLNLRNDVCHGMAPASKFNFAFADRLIHSLLVLAQVRKKDSPADKSTGEEDEP